MITPDTTELLSRYLDDDLDQEESRRLEMRLAADRGLKDELETLRRIRSAVQELARTERAPAAVDQLVGHLERSAPPVPRLRPALRIAAIAATLVIGTAVVLRLSQHSLPQISPPARSAGQVEVKDESRAAPSQTSTAQRMAEGELQEVDRLVSSTPSPARERRVTLGASGKAERPTARVAPVPAVGAERQQARELAASRTQGASEKARVQANEVHSLPLPDTVLAPPAAPASPAAGRPARASEEKGFGQLGVAKESTVAPQGPWSLEIEGRAIALTMRPPGGLAGGRYPVHLTVDHGGQIVAAWSTLEDKNAPAERRRASALDRACALLTGTKLPGVSAGNHGATLIVPQRPDEE